MAFDVAILGAGPAGLAAAWELCAHGVRVGVIEAEPRVGGMAATVQRDGWRFDFGGHRFLTRWPELLERVTRLLGDDLLEVDRHSVVIRDGRRFGYPLEPIDLLRNVPLHKGAHYLGSWAIERILRPTRDESAFEGWMTRRFGAALYRDFFGPYTRRLWGMDPADLSSEWAPERIGSFDLGVALRRMLPSREPPPRTYARRFLYPRLGMGQLFEAIAREVQARGGTLLLGHEVRGLRLEGRRVRAARVCIGASAGIEAERGADEIEARHFVSTLPLHRLAAWTAKPIRARFRGLRFLNLMLEGPAELGSTWAYVSEASSAASRIQEPARRSPFMVPPGRGSLQLEVPASPGDPSWEASDDALWETLRPVLREAGVERTADPLGWFSTRLAYAYPVTTRTGRAEVDAVLGQLGEIHNLVSCGRQARFSYVFADRAMEQGIAAARRFLGLPERLPEPESTACTTEAASLIG